MVRLLVWITGLCCCCAIMAAVVVIVLILIWRLRKQSPFLLLTSSDIDKPCKDTDQLCFLFFFSRNSYYFFRSPDDFDDFVLVRIFQELMMWGNDRRFVLWARMWHEASSCRHGNLCAVLGTLAQHSDWMSVNIQQRYRLILNCRAHGNIGEHASRGNRSTRQNSFLQATLKLIFRLHHRWRCRWWLKKLTVLQLACSM